MDIFKESRIDRLSLFLDYSSRRQQVISSNLANLETPGYRARALDFEAVFQEEVSSGLPIQARDTRHFRARPELLREPVRVSTITTDALGNDLNNVDLDHEMSGLAENILKFSAASQLLRNKVDLLRRAIQGG